MIIETKFNLNDHVWFMKNNKPVEGIISCIEVFEVGTNMSRIKYSAMDVLRPATWIDHENLIEDILFRSKEELLESL